MKRVVITSKPGVFHALGETIEDVFEGLSRGERKFAPINPQTHFDPEDFNPRAIGKQLVSAVSLTDAGLVALLQPGGEKWHDRHELFAIGAAVAPMLELQLSGALEACDLNRFGTSFGTGDGGLSAMHTATAKLLNGGRLGPRENLAQLPNIHAGLVARLYGLKGPNFVNCTACAASTHALIAAVNAIKGGQADMMLVGGTEAAITPFGIASFNAQGALGNSLPFQAGRDGFVMAEGATAFIVEDLEHAMRRGATIYGEVLGYGSSCDANPDSAITSPDPDGGYRSFTAALQMAGLPPESIDYINTHGTGTPAGDVAEIEGIRRWAGGHLPKLMVSSTKSGTGHLLGTAGALEAGLCLWMLLKQVVLPTIGLTPDNLDPACAGPNHVMEAENATLDIVASNSFGFGGTNASVIIGRYS